MVLTIDARKVGEVYVKLAKYMLSVKPILFSRGRGTVSVFPLLDELKNSLSLLCYAESSTQISYPKRESTNISANKTSVSFGLTFLQGNINKYQMISLP